MKKSIKQLTKSFFLGSYATVVDFALFTVLHFFILIKLSNIPFNFGPFTYGVEDGGLCTFLSMAISYLIGQIVNYFVQRKYAFNAKGNTNIHNFNRYIIISILDYFIVLYLPGIIGGYINNIIGFHFGAFVTKAISQFIGFLIQYPFNKFVVFKNHN